MKTETASDSPGGSPGARDSLPTAHPGAQVGRGTRWGVVAVAILALLGIALYLALRFLFHVPRQATLAPLYFVLLLGGLPLVYGLGRKLLAGQFGSDLLAGMSILTAVLEGEFLVGAIVVLMLSGGAALEELASRRASSVLDALAKRMPRVAHRKIDARVEDVTLDEVRVGDFLVIYPHEACPADGVVVENRGEMDESYLTGEPFEISKAPGSTVISGALNGPAALTIRAERLPVDSRYARIMRVMEETQQRRPTLRRLGDQLGAWYTPVALAVAFLAWGITRESHWFLAVLVIATPCPLLIAIPVAIIGAISFAARRGIIIKNPAILEQIDTCKTFIFDKTGTLTYGEPSLTEIECAPGFERDEVLRIAASLEPYSKHPLARAILDAAKRSGLTLDAPTKIHESPGEGVRGLVGGKIVLLTGRDRAGERSFAVPPARSGLECLVIIDGVFAAVFRFRDAPRKETSGFVGHLGPQHQVEKVLIVSGDRISEVRYLAEEAGIAHIHAAKSPEEKVEIVREEMKQGKTVFVGDGINDAPAMVAATVGIAFGQSTDIAAEAADAVVLESSLGKVDELMHIGRRMRSIALESAVGGMALSIAGMLAAALGYLPPIAGAIAQELIDLAAVLNAVRVALPFGSVRDF